MKCCSVSMFLIHLWYRIIWESKERRCSVDNVEYWWIGVCTHKMLICLLYFPLALSCRTSPSDVIRPLTLFVWSLNNVAPAICPYWEFVYPCCVSWFIEDTELYYVTPYLLATSLSPLTFLTFFRIHFSNHISSILLTFWGLTLLIAFLVQ